MQGAASQHDDRWFRSGLLSFARLMCFWRIEQRPCTWLSLIHISIVKLQLGRLAGLEILKIEEELASLQAKIENWEAILADDARVLAIVKEELLEMKKRFGDERRTEIQSVTGEVDIEDLDVYKRQPQSYVLADGAVVDTVYLSELSPAAMRRRAEKMIE